MAPFKANNQKLKTIFLTSFVTYQSLPTMFWFEGKEGETGKYQEDI